jgi:hypothetical protein
LPGASGAPERSGSESFPGYWHSTYLYILTYCYLGKIGSAPAGRFPEAFWTFHPGMAPFHLAKRPFSYEFKPIAVPTG